MLFSSFRSRSKHEYISFSLCVFLISCLFYYYFSNYQANEIFGVLYYFVLALISFAHREKEGGEEKSKKVKRKIPAWATMSASKLACAPKSLSVSQPKVGEILIDAIQVCLSCNNNHKLCEANSDV